MHDPIISIRKNALLTVAASAIALGCAGPSETEPKEDIGEVRLAIAQAPADVACLRVTAVGARTVVQTGALTPGQSTIFTLGRVPRGAVALSAEAFTVDCQAIDGASPGWSSEPVTIDVQPPQVAQVTLRLLRNGQVMVTADFEEESDGGVPSADGGTTADTMVACTEETAEPNDTVATANAFGTLPPATVGQVTAQICAGNRDFYSIDLSAGAVLTVMLAGLPGAADLDVRVLSPSNAILATGQGATPNEQIVITAPSSGTYAVEVFGFPPAAGQGGYRLTLSVAGL